MQPSTLLFFILIFFLGFVQLRQHQPRGIPSNLDVYRKLQARVVPVVSSSTTRVAIRKVQPASRIRGKRQNYVFWRISAALNQFLHSVDDEAVKIKSYAVKGSSPDTIFNQVKGPLENILKAAQQALSDVNTSENAPAPSAGFQPPPTSSCSLVLALIRSLKGILSNLLDALDPSYVKANFSDIFIQITRTVSQIISQAVSKLPGMKEDLVQTGRDVLDSITSTGFGFDDILNVLKPN